MLNVQNTVMTLNRKSKATYKWFAVDSISGIVNVSGYKAQLVISAVPIEDSASVFRTYTETSMTLASDGSVTLVVPIADIAALPLGTWNYQLRIAATAIVTDPQLLAVGNVIVNPDLA